MRRSSGSYSHRMPYYYCKLVAPRATFAQDMNEAETAAMQTHAAYWQERTTTTEVLAVGLVGHPAGAFGVAILGAGSDAELAALLYADPAMTAAVGLRYETYPMPLGRVIHS